MPYSSGVRGQKGAQAVYLLAVGGYENRVFVRTSTYYYYTLVKGRAVGH